MTKIAVVIPCFKVTQHILDVLAGIGPLVQRIYVVDDCCPQQSGDYVLHHCRDPRVRVKRHEVNQGVGGAVMTGYQLAIEENMEIIVKLDGDGQMDPDLIPEFVRPLVLEQADYAKGNRFFDLETVRSMPRIRLFGNALLSFMNKLSSGYWNIFDPTNGYTAIHVKVAKHLPLQKISRRYFFETDMLFRLNTLKAVVIDIPMEARYGEEVSNLKIHHIVGEFLLKHIRNCCKRIFYNYYLRDMSLGSLQLPLGLVLLSAGSIFGTYRWMESAVHAQTASAGTVMLAALPIIVGIQFILAFFGEDIASVPSVPIAPTLRHTAVTHRPNFQKDLSL